MRNVSAAFLEAAEAALSGLHSTTDHPLPDVGHVTFYVLTYSGVVTADALEADLNFSHLGVL